MKVANSIQHTKVNTGELAIFYLAQAGFCFKTSSGQIVYIDAYLTDACNRLHGFKRMSPPVIEAEQVQADIYASTHHHADHLDPDAIPIVARNDRTHFIGAPDCEPTYLENDIPENRYTILKTGMSSCVHGITFKGAYADHGKLAPEAIGLLMDFDEIKVYTVGDSAYQPEAIKESLATDIDIMIAPINGQFGNMNAEEACWLAKHIEPRICIAAHFWMFIEHDGDPAEFLEQAKSLPEDIKAVVMAPGEMLVYSREKPLRVD